MATITVMDPVTRIEGHMKVEVTIDHVAGRLEVIDAKCTGTLFRGFETILRGRDPWDAPIITQRICGVCPVSHGMASVMALDAAADRTVPDNGRLLRNLVLGANFLQSHILHFYLLAALDYVKPPVSIAPWTPAWNVPVRNNLTISGNMVQAMEARRRAHEMGAVFGGKMPTPHTYVTGGFTSVPTAPRINEFRSHLNWLTDFIRDTYIADAEALYSDAVYSEYQTIGLGCGNLLAYGVFDLDNSGKNRLFERGTANVQSPGRVLRLNAGSIKESVTYSWYNDATNERRPARGATKPVYPKDGAYSWLKAPRYQDEPYEAGPLARMWVNGDYRKGVSVMDRHLARAYEALKIAKAMRGWLNELTPGAESFDSKVQLHSPGVGVGVGLTEAPRGALGHWVKIANGKISNYQVITPTCWNASPRDSQTTPGPMEQALIGTPVKDVNEPIEALRVIHSFDPCLSCAVHVMRPGGRPVVIKTGCRG